VSRRGPRADLDVRAVVLDVAERMFGTQGPEAVSLRAVAREAGVAPAAVSHHFPGKTALIAAVVARRSPAVSSGIRAGLQPLLDAGEVPVRALVDAVLRPLVGVLADDPVGGLSWLKVLVRLALDDDPLFAETLHGEPGLDELFSRVAARALPDHADADVRRRTGIAMLTMLTALSGADLRGYGRPLGAAGLDPAWVEQLALFTSAGLTATSRPRPTGPTGDPA